SLPFYLLCDLEFVKKLEDWVKSGGVLILSWRTGIRNKDNIAINLKLPGYFSKLAGINIDRFESLNNTKTHIKIGLFRFKVEAWADILNPVTAKVIARYSDKKKHYNGSAAITVNIFGKGKVYYIGTSPSTTGLLFLYHKIFRKEKMKPKFYGEGIESIDYLDKNNKTFKVIINNSNKNKRAFGKKLTPYSIKIKE
ncbi:MAG TPA: beta-galactosidase trimerization domain-containing protein, partial [Exilispira sp.]|nr:beta-galactosidase trimerization domain-containing protein [Exilispira sp.]